MDPLMNKQFIAWRLPNSVELLLNDKNIKKLDDIARQKLEDTN